MIRDEGDRERRFNEVFDACHEAVRAYAWRRDPALADDVVAETFLLAWRKLDAVPAEPLPWLLGVARYVRLNLRRGERRRASRELGARRAADVEGFAPAVDERLSVHAALARLSERDREVLLLTAWERLDRRGIAAVLGCSTANVAVRLLRARRRLAALLADDAAARPTSTEGATDAC
jgi:RNA polymerase sigma-70 factor (ECF subfamily)